MAKETSDTRTTVEQTPFPVPDLSIKDLLSAIPYVFCWHRLRHFSYTYSDEPARNVTNVQLSGP